jgi:hypothetical protein
MNLDMILKLDDSIRNGTTEKAQLRQLFNEDDQSDVEIYLRVHDNLSQFYEQKSIKRSFKSSLAPLNDEFFTKTVEHPKTVIKRKNIFFKRVGIAATCFVLIGIGVMQYAQNNYSPASILDEYQVLDYTTTRSVNQVKTIPVEQLYEEGKYEEVISSLSIEGIEPKHYLMLGNAHFMLKHYDDAIKNYRIFGEMNPDSEHEYYYNSVLAYIGKKDIVNAEDLINKALQDPDVTSKYIYIKLKDIISNPLMKLTY